MQAASSLPAERGVRYHLAEAVAGMPLIARAGLYRMDTALWLPNHRHRDAELHYIHRGRLDIELPGPRPARLLASGGWFMLTAPGRVHRARDGIMPPGQLLWLQLRPDSTGSLRGSPFDAAGLRHVRHALDARLDQAWPAPPETAALFVRLAALAPRTADPLAAAALRAGLAEMLVLAAQPAGERSAPPALATALTALAGAQVTIAAAARAAAMSPGTLHALCAAHLGSTPAAWQLSCRLDHARERLAAGEAVADVAEALGFSSPRYFAHAFRREVGVPPSQFAALRRRARQDETLAW